MLEYQTTITCKELVIELMERTIKISRTRLCSELVEKSILGASWEELEIQRMLREIMGGKQEGEG